MAIYTTEVRTICEHFAAPSFPDGLEYHEIGEIVAAAEPKIFTFTYPIWEGGNRQLLNQTILWHFYFREIGMETYGLWKAFLQRKLQERMPYYVKFQPTTVVDYDYMNDFYLHEIISDNGTHGITGNESKTQSRNQNKEFDGTVTDNFNNYHSISSNGSNDITNTNTQNVTSQSNNSTAHSDFPQAVSPASMDYATTQDVGDSAETSAIDNSGVSKTTTKNTTTDDSQNSGTRGTENKETLTLSDQENGSHTENHTTSNHRTREQYGNVGGKTPTDLIMDYRNSIVDVFPLIMDDLEELFMNIY